MPVLTQREHDILTDKQGCGHATLREKKDAEKKLQEFQKSKTDMNHVRAINALIPEAEKKATAEIEFLANIGKDVTADDYDRAFHRTMNRLAAQAGLRN